MLKYTGRVKKGLGAVGGKCGGVRGGVVAFLLSRLFQLRQTFRTETMRDAFYAFAINLTGRFAAIGTDNLDFRLPLAIGAWWHVTILARASLPRHKNAVKIALKL